MGDTMEKYLGTAVLFVIFLGHCSCDCPVGTYGFQCGYQCHCLPGDCDPTSGCNSGRCYPGWSGATCHKHNAALKKDVSSSGNTDYPSSLATDGHIGDRLYADCIVTDYSNPNWWRVDHVDFVVIHDVTFRIIIDYTPTGGFFCYTVRGNRDVIDMLSIPCYSRGRYVLMNTTRDNYRATQPTMDFCEVEVDVCDPGTFGADCEIYCHCKDGVCNDITGVCPPGGCLAGWKGTNCDVKCDDNVEYGPDCGGACSALTCKEAVSTCPRDTGRCDGGCQPGWEDEDCTYGMSHCHVSPLCNVRYGSGVPLMAMISGSNV